MKSTMVWMCWFGCVGVWVLRTTDFGDISAIKWFKVKMQNIKGLGFRVYGQEGDGLSVNIRKCKQPLCIVLFPPTHEPNLYLKFIIDVFELFMACDL